MVFNQTLYTMISFLITSVKYLKLPPVLLMLMIRGKKKHHNVIKPFYTYKFTLLKSLIHWQDPERLFPVIMLHFIIKKIDFIKIKSLPNLINIFFPSIPLLVFMMLIL